MKRLSDDFNFLFIIYRAEYLITRGKTFIKFIVQIHITSFINVTNLLTVE